MTTPSAHPLAGRARLVAVLLAAALLAAACGHRIDREDLLAANARVLDTGDPSQLPAATSSASTVPGHAAGTNAPTGDGTTPAPTGPATPTSAGGSALGNTTAPCSTPNETGPITIGSVGNYSGLGGPGLTPMVRAVQVWVEYVNSQGGLCGRRVDYTVVDDRGDPAQHVAALRDLVESRHVVAFVENAAALTIASGQSYLESAGVPVIGTACVGTVEWHSPIMFPQCGDPDATVYGIVRSGVQFGGTTKLAFLYCAESQVCANAHRQYVDNGVAADAGAQVVYSARVSIVQPDFTSECQQARDAGADMMAAFLETTGLRRLIESCHRQGYDPLYALASAQMVYDSKDQPGLERMVGTLQVFPFAGSDTPARAEFQQVMASLYGQAPGPAEAYGWAAAKEFELAVTRAAQTAGTITPRSLVDALHTFQGETLGGLTVPLTFPAGGNAQTAPCWFAVSTSGGQWQNLNGGDAVCR